MNLPLALQELKPESAHLCLKIEKNLYKYFDFSKPQHFLLAISGGADSTALAVIFQILSRRLGFLLTAVHLNHQIRPAAFLDELFVKEMCGQLSIPGAFFKFNALLFAKHQNCGLEEAGHKARLNLFLAYMREIGANCLVTAHHAADLAEDIMMRLLRGASWPALGGMQMKQARIFRPFLAVSGQELRNFLAAENISWREDESNSSRQFLRNRLRHEVLPLLLAENPALNKKMWELNQFAEMDRSYWQEKLRIFFADNVVDFFQDAKCLILYAGKIRKEMPAFRLRIYHHAIKILLTAANVEGQARAETLFRLDKALMLGRKPKIFQLPGHIRIFLKNDILQFEIKPGKS